MTQLNPKFNAALPEKQQWQLLIDTIASEENAFSIGCVYWDDFGKKTEWPDDSFQGKCGTPACILGWVSFLGLSIHILESIFVPDTNNSNAQYCYSDNSQWFTRAKTVAMLKHFVATAKWDGDGKMIKQGDVDWLLDEREVV